MTKEEVAIKMVNNLLEQKDMNEIQRNMNERFKLLNEELAANEKIFRSLLLSEVK